MTKRLNLTWTSKKHIHARDGWMDGSCVSDGFIPKRKRGLMIDHMQHIAATMISCWLHHEFESLVPNNSFWLKKKIIDLQKKGRRRQGAEKSRD
jgi:hypothetical protein